jgi:hypothetical protein
MGEREEWELEQERRKLLQDKMVTEYKKNKFIEEIKSGLGDEILQEPNKVYKRPSFWSRFKKVLGWN